MAAVADVSEDYKFTALLLGPMKIKLWLVFAFKHPASATQL
jgi:hypothetical protein